MATVSTMQLFSHQKQENERWSKSTLAWWKMDESISLWINGESSYVMFNMQTSLGLSIGRLGPIPLHHLSSISKRQGAGRTFPLSVSKSSLLKKHYFNPLFTSVEPEAQNFPVTHLM